MSYAVVGLGEKSLRVEVFTNPMTDQPGELVTLPTGVSSDTARIVVSCE